MDDLRSSELIIKKNNTDQFWERIFNEALKGNIDRQMLLLAMIQCNIADKAIIDYEYKSKRY